MQIIRLPAKKYIETNQPKTLENQSLNKIAIDDKMANKNLCLNENSEINKNNFDSFNLKKLTPDLCLTIGNFDGIHLGHQSIIARLKEISQQKKLASAIMTFEPHPLAFFNDNKKYDFRITTLKQKIKILQNFGIDYLILQNFNQNFSQLSADFFISNLLEKSLSIKHLIIGYDFTFGKNRQGNFKDLENRNFILEEVNPYKFSINNQLLTCSSTLIRSLIKSGKIRDANKILGHNFKIEGKVIHGKKLARTLGFPTINIICKPQQIQPKFGVYKSLVKINNSNDKLLAITNFGLKPTFINDVSQPLYETHILNYQNDLYDQNVVIELESFIRDEIKFSTIEQLKTQINLDIKGLNN